MKITINFFGIPSLSVDNQEIKFPTQKIAGLVFYIFFEKKVLRSYLATLFWEDKDKDQAFSNLRNALYNIKKLTTKELFIIDRRSVSLSPDLIINTDINELESLELCSLTRVKKLGMEFLSGINFEGEEFNQWLSQKRQDFLELYDSKIEQRIETKLMSENFEDAIHCLKLLINNDDLNEENYLRLMKVYVDSGQISKAIKLYTNLERLLSQELDIEPCQEIKNFYSQLLNNETKINTADNPFPFYGRNQEIDKILKHLKTSDNKHNIYINISGNAGIGKSYLINHLLYQLSAFKPLRCQAYEASEKYSYSPWNVFFKAFATDVKQLKFYDPLKIHILKTYFPLFEVEYNLPDNINFTPLLQTLNPIQLGEILAEVLNNLQTRRLLVLEDFQWFDRHSIEMLQSVLLNTNNLTVISISRNTKGDNNLLSRIAQKQNLKICQINLVPFNRDETGKFCELALKNKLSSEEIDKVFKDTEGIPLFIAELLNILREGGNINSLTDRIYGLIENRLKSLPEIQIKILEYLSAFTSEAFYSDFVDLFNQLEQSADNSQLLTEHLDMLCKKNYLRERISGANNLKLGFTHDKIQNYVYQQISEIKRILIHENIAKILEKMSMKNVWDNDLANETIYHLHKSSNDIEALNFELTRLRRHVLINHELFPLIEDSELIRCGVPFSTRETTEEKLLEAEKALDLIKIKHGLYGNTLLSQALYQEISGSYNIYFGNYKDGAYAISQALKYAKTKNNSDIAMRCLLQKAFIGVQIEDYQAIIIPASKLYDMAKQHKSDIFAAIALRFIGVAKQISGYQKTADKMFLSSISILKSLAKTGESYSLNILAALNYIGELHHRNGLCEKALDCFTESLGVCQEKNLFWGRPLFHSNIGYVYLSKQKLDEAEKHVNESIRLFETTPGGRKNSIAYSLKAFLEAHKNEKESCLKYLAMADELCEPIGKKSWMALQLWIKAHLKTMPLFSKDNDDLLKHSYEEYLTKAQKLFYSINFNYNNLNFNI